MTECPRCKKHLPVDLAGKVVCVCGNVFSSGAPIAKKKECIHKGQRIGYADCGCQGNMTIYSCALHSICMDRKLKPGKVKAVIGGQKQCVDMAYCNGCADQHTDAG